METNNGVRMCHRQILILDENKILLKQCLNQFSVFLSTGTYSAGGGPQTVWSRAAQTCHCVQKQAHAWNGHRGWGQHTPATSSRHQPAGER